MPDARGVHALGLREMGVINLTSRSRLEDYMK